jgi:3D-(3,5/4)-trihydroxycyclohexane-1,2-dione acylhydrolase (decyclizing)
MAASRSSTSCRTTPGNESFNNLIADCPTVAEPFAVDFEAHAAAMGATAETVSSPAELAEAFKRAKAADKTHVIVMKVDAYDGWTTQGHAWWEVGTPHVTENPKVKAAHEEGSDPRQTAQGCVRR